MVVMRRVVIGAQHRLEPLAGAGVDQAQKLARLLVAMPALLDRDPPAVRQDEGRHIDGVAVRMFAQLPAAGDRPAIIGAERLDLLDLRAEDDARGGLHAITRPGREIGRQVARHRAQPGGRHADVQQLDAVDRIASAAEIAVGQGGEGHCLRLQLGEALSRFQRRLRWPGRSRRRAHRLRRARDLAARHQVAAASRQRHHACQKRSRGRAAQIAHRPLFHESGVYHRNPLRKLTGRSARLVPTFALTLSPRSLGRPTGHAVPTPRVLSARRRIT